MYTLLLISTVSLHELKTPTFSIHSLAHTVQEVRVYFVAMITLRHVLVREHSMYAHELYHVCDYATFNIHSTTAHLYGAPVISAYGAGVPKVIRIREGHAGKQHIIA